MSNSYRTKYYNLNDDILLKEISLDQAKTVFEAINSNRNYLRVWLPFIESIKIVKDIEHYIASLNTKPEAFEPVFCVYHQNNFAGLVGFKNTNLKTGSTEIGY